MGNRASKIFEVTEDPLPVAPVEIPDEPAQEPSKEPPAPPKPPVAYIDCGSASDGHESNDLVSVSGNTSVARFPLTEIEAENPDFSSFGRTQRWAQNNFTYTIQVPVPGEYDVTLVFAETYDGAFGVGKRIFNAVIRGTKSFAYDNIDVFQQVGANKVFKIAIQNVSAEYAIHIDLKKGAIQNPMISGIVVGAVENPVEPVGRPPIPTPTMTVSQAQYDDCIAKIDAYIEAAKASAPTEVREVPQYLFHTPGTPVRGLIMTFHGFSGKHYDSRILARYLYDQGYDVFHTMLAGHMYSGQYWPTTKLSDKYGGDTVGQSVMQDPELAGLLGQSQQNPTLIPRFLRKLREKNPEFERVMSAQTYMASLDQDEDPNFATFFKSNHRDYATEGTTQLRLLDSHPGPVHVTGLSVGGAAAIAVAAANPERVERCIAMAPLLELYEPAPNTKRALVNYIGPLSVAPDFAWDPATPFPVSAFTAAGRLGGSLTSSKKYQDVFKSGQVQLFMILTEDEDAADIQTNKQFFDDCGGRASGHHYFIYPFSYAVPHPLLDPTARSRGLRNAFYKALYQMCYTFFAVGHADGAFLLQNDEDPTLPKPPKAMHGHHGAKGFYGRAAQTGKHTATSII